jgi:hypothetical protein
VILLAATGPELPLHTAVKYVAAAYIVFLLVVLVYVGIMANRLRHTERDLVQLRRDLEAAKLADASSVDSSAGAELSEVGRQ